jgi:hypothetical protein
VSFSGDIATRANRPQYIAEIDIQDGGVVLEAFDFPRVAIVAPTNNPGYALVDDFEAIDDWTEQDYTDNLATSGTKIEGTYSLTFDKTSTAGLTAGIIKTVTLDFSAVQRWRVAFHLPSTAVKNMLASVRIRLDESGGAFTTCSDFTVAASALTVGWNWLEFSPGQPTSTTGTPTLAAIDRIAFGVITNLVTDLPTALKFDDFCTLDYGYVAVGDATYPQGIHTYSTSGEAALAVSKQGTNVDCGIEFEPAAAIDMSGYDAVGYDVRVPTTSTIASAKLKMFDASNNWSMWSNTRTFVAEWNSPKFDIVAQPDANSGTLNLAAVTKIQAYLTFNQADNMMTDIVFDRMVGWIGPSIITTHPVSDLSDSLSLQGAMLIPSTISQKASPELGKTEISGMSFGVVDRKSRSAVLNTTLAYDGAYTGDGDPTAETDPFTLTGVNHGVVDTGMWKISGAGTDLSYYTRHFDSDMDDALTTRSTGVMVEAGLTTRFSCTFSVYNANNCFVTIDIIDGKIYVCTETAVGMWFEDEIPYDTTSDPVVIDVLLESDGTYTVWLDTQCYVIGTACAHTPASSQGRIVFGKDTTDSENHAQWWDSVSWRSATAESYPMMRCATLNELRGRRVRLLMGFAGYTYDEYQLIDTYRINAITYDSGQYDIKCDNDLGIMKQPCMPLATKDNLITVTGNILTIWLQMLTSTGYGTNGPYDVLPSGYGIGFPFSRLNIPQIEYERDTWMPLWLCEVTFTDRVKDFKDWADVQIFKASGAILRIKNGKIEVKARRVPLSADVVYEIDESGLSEDKSNWSLDMKEIYNQVVFKYNKATDANEYGATSTYNADTEIISGKTSQELYGVKSLEINADCIQSTETTAMLQPRASAIFQRYSSGPIEIKAGFPLAAINDIGLGDPVVYTNWQHPNAGSYGYDEVLMEIKEISVDHAKGDIDVILVRSGYGDGSGGETGGLYVTISDIAFDYDAYADEVSEATLTIDRLAHGWISDENNFVGAADDPGYVIAP